MDKRGWAQSARFDFAAALIAGFAYALIVLGPRPLNPRNVDWVSVDPAYHFIGWELYRQDPKSRWPLTYTDRLAYPAGEAVALTDLNPLLAIALKPFSRMLPEPMQYFGIEVVLVCALQLFFAARILRLIGGGNWLAIALASIFFLLAPPFNYRFAEHYSLTNHWLLLAALFIYLREQFAPAPGLSRFAISATALAAVAIAINPYLAFEVVLALAASIAALAWHRRMSVAGAAGILGSILAVCAACAWAIGLLITGGRGYASGGYRDLSMNLLAPIDPRGWASVAMPRLPSASPGQYEGYNYFGAGALALTVVVGWIGLSRMRRLRGFDWRWVVPLGACCVLLTLMALSTRITLGGWTLIDLDPSERFSPYLAPLRASGRLFWFPYYTILAAVLGGALRLLRPFAANLLLTGFLILQIADTDALRQWVRTTVNGEHPSPLRSPVWAKLGDAHANLIVLPAWQCAQNASPGGPEGYRIFGFLAVREKMRINSYQSARYTGRDAYCRQSASEIATRPLATDSVYVVTPEIAEAIARGPSGPGKCHDLDNFILCSARSDFGLSPVLMTPMERLEHAIVNPGFEAGDSLPWTPVLVHANVSRTAAHSGAFSLAETDGAGSVYQDVNGLQTGAVYRVSAWVSGSAGASARIAVFNPSDNTTASSPVVDCGPEWRLLSVAATAGREGAMRIHLMRTDGAGAVFWDDARITVEGIR